MPMKIKYFLPLIIFYVIIIIVMIILDVLDVMNIFGTRTGLIAMIALFLGIGFMYFMGIRRVIKILS